MMIKHKLVIVIVACYIALFAISFNFGTIYYVKHDVKEPDKSVFNVSKEELTNYSNEIIIYDVMHKMAKSKIEADKEDKSGNLEINKRKIEAVRTIVIKMNYPDKEHILEILNRWDKGEFSNISSEYEYFFGKYKQLQ